jgi:hypothetical protein
MAFPQIGLEAVLQIQNFERNAAKYNRTLDQMNKRTRRASDAIGKSTRVAADSAFDLTRGFREAAGGVDAAAQESVNSIDNLRTAFSQLAVGGGILAAGLAGTAAAIRKLLAAGEEAAALEDMRQSYIALAATSGISASQLVSDLRRITRGTVETSRLIRTANVALLAGGAQLGEDLPRYLKIASDAARSTGQDLDYVTETLIKGVVKGSPLLIDNAELYLNIGRAVEDYAASVGKSVDELSRQERTLATGNAVLEQGAAAYGKLGLAAEAATDPFRQLSAQSSAFGTGLKTVVAPAAEFVARSLQGLILASKTSLSVFAGGAAVLINFGAILRGETTVVEAFRERFDEVFRTLDTGIAPIEDTATGIGAIGQAAEQSASGVSELNKKLADLEAQRGERLAKIALQNARRDRDIAIQRARQLVDVDRQLSRQREDRERETGRARARIGRDNARRIANVERDNARKQHDLVAEAQRAREELERTHRENLFQINQKASDTIGEAARRNDAVAIAQALRQKQRELRDEQRSKKIEQADLGRDLQIKQQKADEDAALSLEKARQQAAQQLIDQQASEAQQEESLRLSLQRQEEDRRIAWQRQSEDRARAMARQLEDVDLWYRQEQAKLKENLKKQTQIAVAGIQSAGVAIAQVTAAAISTIGLSAEQQFQRRGTYLQSATPVSTLGLSEEEQRRLRGSYLRRAEGGMDIVDRPTKFLAGEAGPELAAFVPLRNNRLDIGGRVGIDVQGIPGGMDSTAVEQMVFAAMVELANRIRVAR